MSRSVKILAIDPGNTESGFAVINAETCRRIEVGKVPNEAILELCYGFGPEFDRTAIEMVASYGMAVGKEVFETCVWIGRFQEALLNGSGGTTELVYRRDVKLHHCNNSRAKDSNITQALIDRFASGVPNRGKGTKADPGWFYGFRADIWQAYALAVLVADTEPGPQPPVADAVSASTPDAASVPTVEPREREEAQ